MSQVTTQIHDHQDGSITVYREQDCEPILERCKALANSGLKQSSEMRLAATIPNVVIEQYCNLNGITFHDFMVSQDHQRRLLNDPDMKFFRVWPGKI